MWHASVLLWLAYTSKPLHMPDVSRALLTYACAQKAAAAALWPAGVLSFVSAALAASEGNHICPVPCALPLCAPVTARC